LDALICFTDCGSFIATYGFSGSATLIAIGVHFKNRTNYVFRDEAEKKEEEYSSNG
jgi:hypothetical protein